MITEYILKRGEVGSRLEFTLIDENGAVNLNGWTVTMTVRKGTSTPVIDDAACTLLPNQATTDKGKGYFTFNSTTAEIPVGTYDLEFKGVTPSLAVYYFPKSKDEKFARMIVINPLED